MSVEITEAARILGRLGGQKNLALHGVGFYSRIGRIGGQAVARERGSEFYRGIGKIGGAKVAERGVAFFQEIGRKGGLALSAKRGREYYREIGRKGGPRRRSPRGDAEDALVALRKGANLTQDEMARRLGVHQSAISAVECGRAGSVANWKQRYEKALRET